MRSDLMEPAVIPAGMVWPGDLVQHAVMEVCQECAGSGWLPDDEMRCAWCLGSGDEPTPRPDAPWLTVLDVDGSPGTGVSGLLLDVDGSGVLWPVDDRDLLWVRRVPRTDSDLGGPF